MRSVGVAEKIGGGRGDDRDVNMHFAVLNCLIAAAMGAQHAQAAHFALRAIVAEGPVHRAFDVMDHSLFHQLDRAFLRRERRARKPHQIFHADFRRRFERHERDLVAVAQMVMARDHHAVAQSALAQRGLEIGHALVACVGIVLVRRDRRRCLLRG